MSAPTVTPSSVPDGTPSAYSLHRTSAFSAREADHRLRPALLARGRYIGALPAPGAHTPGPAAQAVRLASVLLAAGLGILLMGRAVAMGRDAQPGADQLYWAALFVPFVVNATVMLARSTARWLRVVVAVTVAVLPTVYWRLMDPFGVVAFDEQLHVRTLVDLLNGAPLFSPNPLLPVSSWYPGMETATVFLTQLTDLEPVAALTVLLVACRVALALGIFGLGLVLTRSSRAAGLAVLVYACSPQFSVFNSQYSYQSMALPLGVCAVLLLHRAQRATTHRWLLTAAAVVCLGATVFTHHLTGVTIVLAVVGWASWASVVRVAVAARRGLPIRAALDGMGPWGAAAVLGSLALGLWTAHVSTNLSGYLNGIFGATISQLSGAFAGGETRQFFADEGGTTSAASERYLLYAYAGLWVVLALWAGLVLLREAVRARRWTLVAVAVLAGASPAALGGRIVPAGMEMGDRASNFIIIPLALAAAAAFVVVQRRGSPAEASEGTTPGSADRDDLTAPRGGVRGFVRRLAVPAVATVLALAAVGGTLLGWGPSWNRLPGPYIVTADYRSADEWTRAGVGWAERNLAPGSRIVADRYPATMLSAQARLYPVVSPEPHPVTGEILEPADIYFADLLGIGQTEVLQGLNIHYIWVDTRLSESLPHLANYIYPGENSKGVAGAGHEKLTEAELTKFDTTPGLRAVYRQGPIVIYDTTGLGVQPLISGYTGTPEPVDARAHLLAGLTLAVLLVLVALPLSHRLRAVGRALGLAGCVAVAVATLSFAGALSLGLGVPPSPWFGAGVLVALLLGAVTIAALGREPVGRGRRAEVAEEPAEGGRPSGEGHGHVRPPDSSRELVANPAHGSPLAWAGTAVAIAIAVVFAGVGIDSAAQSAHQHNVEGVARLLPDAGGE